MRTKAQIVATVGPASKTTATISAMLDAGMDVMRLNFSHGTHGEHAEFVRLLREAAQEKNMTVPVIQDLSGPRMKTDSGHGFDNGKSVITEKDLADLVFANAQAVEWIAQSYVGHAQDVAELRSHLTDMHISARIIAKIERKDAVDGIEAILAEADAVMVARGDLGDAIPIEDIPFVERDIIQKANALGKPVIVATQMLFSMVENAAPSRAEVTDVAFAILSGADAIMLSDETAKGKHPIEAVQYMEQIAARAEKSIPNSPKRLL